MHWDVLTKLTPPVIQLHWASAALAFLFGLAVLVRPKGTLPHRLMGLGYAAFMFTTAIAAFFVRYGEVSGLGYLTLEEMSWIHIFVPVTLVSVSLGLHAVLARGSAKAHRRHMIGSFLGALVIAGAFTFLPDRGMHLLLFGPEEEVESLVEGAASSLRGAL